MVDLLVYTKMIAEKISYYDSIIDFTNESHWFNPFFKQPNMVVVWIDNYDNNKYSFDEYF